MPRYHHRFTVRAPFVAVADFHNRSASMAAITPPPVFVQMHRAPERLSEGSEMDFTLWLGPLGVYWRARLDHISDSGFTDRQVDGPFRSWVHRHDYVSLADGATLVLDDVTLSFRLHPLWLPVGLAFWLTLPLLFAYRGWQTRRLLATWPDEG